MTKKRVAVIGYGVVGALLHVLNPGRVECLEYKSAEETIGDIDREAPFTYSAVLLDQIAERVPSLQHFLQGYTSLVTTLEHHYPDGRIEQKQLAEPRYSFTRRDFMRWSINQLGPHNDSVRFNQKVWALHRDALAIELGDHTMLPCSGIVAANGIYSTLGHQNFTLEDPHRSFMKLDALPLRKEAHLEVYHQGDGFVIRYPLGPMRSVCLWSAPESVLAEAKELGPTLKRFQQDYPELVGAIPDLDHQVQTHPVTPILYRVPSAEIMPHMIEIGDARSAVFPSGGLGADFMLRTVLTLSELLHQGVEDVVDAFYARHPYEQVKALFDQSREMAKRGAFLEK